MNMDSPRRLGLVLMMVLGLTTVAHADRESDFATLIDLMEFEETIDIMRQEGIRYGADIARDMLPGTDMVAWEATVARIYNPEKLLILVEGRFRQELEDTDLAPILTYYQSDHGHEIVVLELAARRAFLDPGTEEAARTKYETLKADEAPLLAQVDALIADSDLVERNVMGTLNSSMMFYRGLNDGGAYEMTEDDMLADVWAQEDETRTDSAGWLGSFLAMAYQPVPTEQLDTYAAFYRTPEGRDLNRALFAGFDHMYEEVSYLLGLAVSKHLTSEPI